MPIFNSLIKIIDMQIKKRNTNCDVFSLLHYLLPTQNNMYHVYLVRNIVEAVTCGFIQDVIYKN